MRILPDDFDEMVRIAVASFWKSRAAGNSSQGGTRGNVIGGKNLDGFIEVVREVALFTGIPGASVFVRGKKYLTLPGYYRPTKNWDVVIVHKGRLLAVIEFKSQVGSFGNNFNNRVEEALGNATDMGMVIKEGVCRQKNITVESADPRPPFIGYLALIEKCQKSIGSVKASSFHFDVLPEFTGASYVDRYEILCEKMMANGLYNAAALMISEAGDSGLSGMYESLSDATSVKNLFASLSGHLLASQEV